MTGLLVSVSTAEDARAAVRGGADWIDLKDPARGSLGALSPRDWPPIVAAAAGRPLSVALGELLEYAPGELAGVARQLGGFRFAKLGLAGCGGRDDWTGRWAAALASLPAGVAGVAVAYADYAAAVAPEPPELVDAGARLGCRALLVDTWDKSHGDLLDNLPASRLRSLVDQARRRGLAVVLAGSLTAARLPELLPLAPDLVAVRGAVCERGRTGRVSEARVRQLASELRLRRRVAPIAENA